MTLQRSVIHALDRPGGRRLLSMLATLYARRAGRRNTRIFYDDVWMHSVGETFAVDGPAFDYYGNTVRRFADRFARISAACREYWCHVYHPAPGDVILDVGAGLGYDTLMFSRQVGRAGRVLAIEAHPRTFLGLQRLCKWNRLRNVTPVQCAVMDRECEVQIEDRDDHEANTVLIGSDTSPGRSISGNTLDAFCREHGVHRIDFLKMNIEGAEQFAIRGMQESIGRIRSLCIACHDFKRADGGEQMCTKAEVIEFLRDNGFEVVLRDDHPREYARDHVHAFRRA